MIRCGVNSRAAFIDDIVSKCGRRGVYSRAADNRVNKEIHYRSPNHYLIITRSFKTGNTCSVVPRKAKWNGH